MDSHICPAEQPYGAKFCDVCGKPLNVKPKVKVKVIGQLPREEGAKPIETPIPSAISDEVIDSALTRAKVINTMADYIVAVGGREANQDFLDYVNSMQPKRRKLKLSEYQEQRRIAKLGKKGKGKHVKKERKRTGKKEFSPLILQFLRD